jgi:hypothetical protein
VWGRLTRPRGRVAMPDWSGAKSPEGVFEDVLPAPARDAGTPAPRKGGVGDALAFRPRDLTVKWSDQIGLALLARDLQRPA